MTKKQLLEQELLEGRASDYLSANKLSKEDALKPENLKKLRAAMDPAHPTKTSYQAAKDAIEAYFKNKDSKTGDDKASDKDDKSKENKGKEKTEKAELTPEEKEEVKDAVKETNIDMPAVKDARSQAEANPIKGYSLSKKMYFIHVGAKKKAEEAVKKYLQSAKAGEINVKVTNSAVDTTENSFDITQKKYVVGVHVLLDKTNVAGLRKLMAVLKESKQIDEGLIDGLKSMFGRVKQAVKDGANDVKAEAQKKIEATNEKMKELIGVLAIKAYITHFVGKKIGDTIDANLVYAGINEQGEMKGRISYYTAIETK